MDKIEKFIRRLNVKERRELENVLDKIRHEDFEGLDIKKLKNQSGLFRVRKGRVRIVFQKSDNGVSVLLVERRSDDTYTKL